MEPIKTLEEYQAKKEALLKQASDLKFDGLQFTASELEANQKFVELCKKTKPTLDEKFYFRPILFKDQIESSTLYKLLTDMPKGCQQHSHNPCHLPSKWFVPQCLNSRVYINEASKIDVFDEVPATGGWKSVQKLREEAADKEDFDRKFEDNFHMTVKDYDNPVIWEVFEHKMDNRMTVAFQEAEVWEQYLTDAFIFAIEEGYSNLQIRNFIPFYEHKVFMDPEQEAQMYRRCLDKAREKDPNFSIGITFAGLRFFDLEKAKKFLDITYDLAKKYRDVIIGFDLVAEETLQTAEFFAPMFIEHLQREKKEGFELPLIMHGGESIDLNNTNLYDLYLWNVKRIGHGINLFKHPFLLPKIKEKGICIEVNPLSNQILKYVADLRIHPAIGYHNYGLKVTISSDDIEVFQLHTMWDFFVVAMSFEFNLLDMKRVIVNSIETSCLEKSIQDMLYRDWQNKWDAFVTKVNNDQYV